MALLGGEVVFLAAVGMTLPAGVELRFLDGLADFLGRLFPFV
jgi:hypothetical protein